MNKFGLRVDFNRTGGLFRKTPGRTGTRGFRPLDLDLRAKNRSARDLILALGYGSNGAGQLGVRTAALATGVGFPRRRSVIPSPDFIEIAAPRVNLTGIRVWDDQSAVRDRSRASIGHRNALGGDFDCGAELHGGTSPARAHSGRSGPGFGCKGLRVRVRG